MVRAPPYTLVCSAVALGSNLTRITPFKIHHLHIDHIDGTPVVIKNKLGSARRLALFFMKFFPQIQLDRFVLREHSMRGRTERQLIGWLDPRALIGWWGLESGASLSIYSTLIGSHLIEEVVVTWRKV